MRDDPQFLAISIQARLQHAHLLALDGDKEGSKKMIESVQSDVARLSEFPRARVSRVVAAFSTR